MRILFATGDAIAIPSLQLLHAHAMIGAILAPAGRTDKKNNNTTIVSEFAQQHSIPLLQPAKLDNQLARSLDAYSIGLLVCFAYGKYFTSSFLSLFSNGTINIHPSLLPRFRGASPIAAAILAGDTHTGIAIQTISDQLDAGDIVYRVRIPIDDNTTSILLREKIATMIAEPLLNICQQLLGGMPIAGAKQNDNHAVYCRKIKKTDGAILWSMPAQHIIRLVKSMCYWPVAYTYVNGQKLNIIEIETRQLPHSILDECTITTDRTPTIVAIPFGKVLGIHHRYGIIVNTGNGVVGIHKLQLATRKAQHWKDFINGQRAIIGSVLG